MHILIGIITAAAGLIWALYRLQNSGVNLNSFNPFYWMRRRQWEKRLGAKALHRIEKPMEAAAALAVAVTKLEGEISREQKLETISLFEAEFNLENKSATELFASSAFLLQDTMDIVSEVKNILAPSKESFTAEQRESLLALLKKVASLDGSISEAQHQLLSAVASELAEGSTVEQGKWS